MVTVNAAAAVSETARERETFKYDALAISTARLKGPQPPKPLPSTSLTSTPDPGLTAFAQLGLYRLRGSRALISLFDRDFQHIVAEALRSPLLGPDGQPLPGQPEQVWFNGLTFERVTSVCEHVVTGAAVAQSVPGTASGLGVEDIPVSIIAHLDADSRFCQIQDPARQFYAGVPIRSRSGINIGVYCVFDDQPRPEGLSADEVLFMREISKVVMEYLENRRSHEWYRREQRMIRGLGSFVNGSPTLWKPAEHWSDSDAALQDRPGMSEGFLNKKLQPEPAARGQQQKPNQAFDPNIPNLDSRRPSVVDQKLEDNGVMTSISQSDVSIEASSSSSPTLITAHGSSADPLQGGVDRVFSKATNIIRESIEVEGVLFLDASVRSRGGLVGNTPSLLPNAPETRHSSSGRSSSSDENTQSHLSEPTPTGNSTCDILGFSTSQTSSIVGDAPPREVTKCKERLLQRLLRKYPEGHIINFEADGTVSDHSISSDSDRSATTLESADGHNTTGPAKTKKRLNTAALILKMFPGARSIAFVPLRDPQTGRWFAGGFMWTKTPTRTFSTENELSYLRVFGLTVMADVAQLKTRAADNTKSDILGSISHELRSPLHGLVGAVELLRHTTLDGIQDGILRTIEASGRTLLDTIDHLLDYVKINTLRSSRTRHGNRSADSRQQAKTSAAAAFARLEMPIYLDMLVEEVVESVLAGSSHLTRSEMHFPMSTTTARTPLPLTPSRFFSEGQLFVTRGGLQIYLDIDHPADWCFRMHPGAFRRIVMNLFGNSLKFTKTGFIRVSLRQESQSKQTTSAGVTRIVLSVSDSGKGIGEDFLRTRLFTSFAQEDQFAAGTGLGLSLVRNMTAALGGTTQVSSKVGQGTTVTVALPLHRTNDETAAEDDAALSQSVKALEGKRVLLRGFETQTRIRDSFHAEDAKRPSQFQLMDNICRKLLRMDVMGGQDQESASPDFVVCVANEGPAGLDAVTTKYAASCPYILICQDLSSAHRFTGNKQPDSHMVYEVCSQPIGPRKLARALLASQLRWQGAQHLTVGPTTGPQGWISNNPLQQDFKSPKFELNGAEMNLRLAQKRPKFRTNESVSFTTTISESPATPTQQPPMQPSVQKQSVETGSTASNPRPAILIVDDNSINLKIMAAYIAKLKHPYATAMNGKEALERYTSSPGKYRCLLTDISMPVMDGLESTRRIREFEQTQSLQPVVIIALTGLYGGDVQQEAFTSGVDLFLTRPLPLKGIENALEKTGLR